MILGAARQGQALARYLAGRGARVVLNDQRPAAQLQEAQAALAGLPITWVTGGHPLQALEQVDLVCISGGVPLELPIIAEAVRRGVTLSNDSQIFMEEVPCPTVGITGSAGKTTTTTLVGRMAQAGLGSSRRAWVGGNIGNPLIAQLDEMKPDDLAILELSSFQLEQMSLSPNVAAVLNVTPNHLDRHGTMEAYTAAKARILAFQSPQDVAVLGREDLGAWALAEKVRGRLVTFSLSEPLEGVDGAYLDAGTLFLRAGETDLPVMPAAEIRLRGTHNLLNVLAACAIAHAAGLSPQAMLAGVKDFGGVPHRLQRIAAWGGAEWYNDSIATAPERSMAAIHSFSEPLVLLAGGRDKNLPWDTFAALVHERVDHLVVFGEAAGLILGAVGPQQPGKRPFTVTRCSHLREAVRAAAEVVQPGDVVLLSPGGTSYDEFKDFEERGERFVKWVKELS